MPCWLFIPKPVQRRKSIHGRRIVHLYLLNTDVTVDINKLPIEHLALIIGAVIVLVAIVFFNGFFFKFGEKEMNIGGILRLLEKRDKDTLLKENLKKYADDVDHEVTANLYDLVEELEGSLEPPLAIGEHCYFSYEKFSGIVKSELYRRIRRNNLWEKLSESGRDKYINTALLDIEKRYKLLGEKASLVKCGDTYAEFPAIKEAIRSVLNKYFNGVVEILVKGMKKKIEEYERVKHGFRTAAARKICCDDCIAKNQSRIEKLNGMSGRGNK